MDENRQYEIAKEDKKLFKLKWILIFIFYFIFFIGIDGMHVYYHEKTHAAIYDVYKVNYSYGWSVQDIVFIAFYVETNDSSMRNCDETCMALQIESEIYTYNLAWIFYSIWIIFFLYLLKCFFEDAKENKKSMVKI